MEGREARDQGALGEAVEAGDDEAAAVAAVAVVEIRDEEHVVREVSVFVGGRVGVCRDAPVVGDDDEALGVEPRRDDGPPVANR